ncbi:complexin-3b isoform X1 [Electrophorus electricus]|uniref:complexin-3b isoform X1 n=1 Tax=Electrophorus electricus TaxID=8005 RepID=UPI0015D0894D|nr:complexin-3b isoform X1 [Electrophorus electricus]
MYRSRQTDLGSVFPTTTFALIKTGELMPDPSVFHSSRKAFVRKTFCYPAFRSTTPFPDTTTDAQCHATCQLRPYHHLRTGRTLCLGAEQNSGPSPDRPRLSAHTCCRVIPTGRVRERDASFAQRKAERATVRSHFREKYRLPKNELDDTQIQAATQDVELPTELAKMIAEDNKDEQHKQSVLGQLSSLQHVDMDHLKDKAQATLEELKNSAEKCTLM